MGGSQRWGTSKDINGMIRDQRESLVKKSKGTVRNPEAWRKRGDKVKDVRGMTGKVRDRERSMVRNG